MMIITDDSGKIFHAEMMLDVEHEAEELRLFGRALLAEVKKLKAQNERIRELLGEGIEHTRGAPYWDERATSILSESPEQSLAAIKAEAVREAVSSCKLENAGLCCSEDLLGYADKLEKGE